MRESRPVPKTAMTAARLIGAQAQLAINDLAEQVVADLGLSEADNWRVDFNTGSMSREVPEPLPDPAPMP